ncbi:MAG: HAMP domain-containing protein [Pirellulales bacterium]
MKRLPVVMKRMSRFFWWVLSVRLFFKILGIGALVAAVFGGITLFQVRASLSRARHQVLEQTTRFMSRSLMAGLERPMLTGDLVSVRQKVRRAMELFPDIRYIIVRDAGGQIVSQFPEKRVPEDLIHTISPSIRSEVRESRGMLIYDVECPILEGRAGVLQIGISDQMVTEELATVTRSLLLTLALCLVLGAGLAVGLTYLLTYPIHHLEQAANRIRGGDFTSRSEIFSADEIGRLALAFNQMADSLQDHRREVEEKEKARLSLIERIVGAQEQERQSISRELHDQLGQSLLALLLTVQSLKTGHSIPEGGFDDIEAKIRELIDEVGRLAWGMRPPILDDYGLDFALARLVKEISGHSKLTIDYQYTCPTGLGRLPSRIEVTLYRIAQEALANVVRHAHATHASAVVLQGSDEVTLLIEDNGSGFDSSQSANRSSSCLGLTGMKERATLLGGHCEVESIFEQGTTVRTRIPVTV